MAVVVWLVVLQAAIRGAFSVFVIVVAIDLLDLPESSVGIQGLVGVGALLGSMPCVMLVGSRAMTRWLGIAVALWGAPLAMIGVLPSYATALVAAVIGVGNALVDVTAFTLLARMAPNAVMARVFGVLEIRRARGRARVAGGAADHRPARHRGGAGRRGPDRATGLPGGLARADGHRPHRVTRTDELAVLRQVPMLRPLPVPVLEQLGRGLERWRSPPGRCSSRPAPSATTSTWCPPAPSRSSIADG